MFSYAAYNILKASYIYRIIHCGFSPLVEEKLNLELQAMQKIHEAQEETDRELENTLERLAKTRIRNEEAHNKAAREREAMAKEIEDVRGELQTAVYVLICQI